MQLQYKPQPARPPVGFPWEWKFPSYQHMDGNGKRILYIGNSHLVILWESYGNSHGNPVGVPIWESCGNTHLGIPTWESHGNSHMGILWESHGNSNGNSHRNPVGMGWEWELKFHSHGNPVFLTT